MSRTGRAFWFLFFLLALTPIFVVVRVVTLLFAGDTAADVARDYRGMWRVATGRW
jgi:hypothetical protein